MNSLARILPFRWRRGAPAATSPAGFAPLAQEMNQWVAEGKVAGGAAVIAIGGRTVFRHAFGFQDRERGIAAAPDTIFHLTSLTKPVTSAGAMALMEEGGVSLDDPVAKFLPDFERQLLWDGNASSEPIRIRHIMTHSSGLLDAIPETFLATDHSLEELVAEAARNPLGFSPGERWSYANVGFDILGRIIEIVSGQPFHEFIRARILSPLRMKDTFYGVERKKESRIATAYSPRDGRLLPEDRNPAQARARFVPPSWGLHSTAPDLARFFQMLMNEGTLGGKRVLSARSVQAMVTSHTGSWNAGFIPGSGYGLGCSVVTSPEGIFRHHSRGTFGHGGCFQTHAWADPEKKVVAVIMCQHRCFDLPVSREVASFLSRSVAIM